jgi:tol-pal system protein YbgF
LIRKREEELKQLRESPQAAQDTQAADIALGESETIRRDYETGWRAFERKDYKGALVRFRDFLRKNPKSRLAASAQYWIGESHFAQREFDRAIVEFDEVRRKYAQSDRVPAALLRQGAAFTELGEKLNARLVLQELVEKYPQSAEAARAKQRLKALES